MTALRSRQETLDFVRSHLRDILSASLVYNHPQLKLVEVVGDDGQTVLPQSRYDSESDDAAHRLINDLGTELVVYVSDRRDVVSLTHDALDETVKLMAQDPRYAPWWRQWAACPDPQPGPNGALAETWIESGCYHATVALLQVACVDGDVFHPQLDKHEQCWQAGDKDTAAVFHEALLAADKELERQEDEEGMDSSTDESSDEDEGYGSDDRMSEW